MNWNFDLLRPMILEKELEYASSLEHTEFQERVCWLENFKKRYALFPKNVCGESADVPVTICKNYNLKLPEIPKDFSSKTIFNS